MLFSVLSTNPISLWKCAWLSWGGGLALACAQRHPDLVRSLVQMSADAGLDPSASAIDRVLGEAYG